MATTLKLKRGTRAQLDAAVTANELTPWEPGYVTDDKHLVIAKTTNTFDTIAGVPEGGTLGQMLVKNSSDDYDAEWVTPEEGSSIPSRIFGYTKSGAALRLWASSEGTGFEATQADGVTKLQIEVQQVTPTEIDGGLVNKTSETGSAVLPTGTTAQRDPVPSPGYVRFNSTINDLEFFDNDETWVPNNGNDNLVIDVAGLSTVDITNIPPWVNKIYLTGQNVTVPSGEQSVLTAGHSEGFTNVNHASFSIAMTTAGAGITSYTDGIYFRSPAAGSTSVTRFTCMLLRTPGSSRDYWTVSGMGIGYADSRVFWIMGQINFYNANKPLTRLRLSTVSPFPGGLISVRWEK